MTTAPAITDTPTQTIRAVSYRRWLPLVLAICVVIGLTLPGIRFRRWAWDFTEPGRYQFDINRNYNFGKEANQNGFLNLYDNQLRDNPPSERKLDYPPLRLATFAVWEAWSRHAFPGATHWSADYPFNAFLMRYNTTLEWLGAVAAFLIVEHWLRQCARSELPDPIAQRQLEFPWNTALRATLAFALLWFDPGVVLIAHGWPSPNMWVIPFYLWTVLLCLWDLWFVAGVLMGIGAMIQGQQLLVAAIFILWPIFAGKPARALRWGSGFVMTFMLIASGWLLTRRTDVELPVRQINWAAVSWLIGTIGLLTTLGFRSTWLRRLDRRWLIALAAICAVVFIWPALWRREAWLVSIVIPIAALLVTSFWFLTWQTTRYLLPLTLGICLLLCIPCFGASTSWWQIGFLYGTERFSNVAGDLANNLPSLLEGFLGWHRVQDTAFVIPQAMLFHWPTDPIVVTVRQLLFTMYLPLLAIAAGAIAMQWRRRDRGLLVALVLPWVMFFTILPQMSPRYAVFAAGVGAICIGRSAGMSLLVWLFSFLTIEQTALCMMGGNWERIAGSTHPLFNVHTRELLERFNPGIAWAEVLAACVFFYVALARSKPRAVTC